MEAVRRRVAEHLAELERADEAGCLGAVIGEVETYSELTGSLVLPPVPFVL